jgi:hypothetical protein
VSRKVILVDGPERGRIMDCDGSTFMVARPARTLSWSLAEAECPHPSFDQVAYHVHRINLFGRLVHVGTTRPEPHEADLFEALASNDAKGLVRI